MADIKTRWVGQVGAWEIDRADLAVDDGLETAVIISLFTDAYASAEEMAAAGVSDRRGWWGDTYADVRGDRIGSKLWLLAREKRLATVVERARRYAEEALQWLVTDGVAARVVVVAEMVGTQTLGLQVEIVRRSEPVSRYAFEAFWKGA